MALPFIPFLESPKRFPVLTVLTCNNRADTCFVTRILEYAQQILSAAEAAASRGETCSETTILIGQDGGIHMMVDSDWPLDSLLLDRGARSAFRVSAPRGVLRVEAREGLRVCVLESAWNPRALLASR
jgi:hypothetical protein